MRKFIFTNLINRRREKKILLKRLECVLKSIIDTIEDDGFEEFLKKVPKITSFL